ncbi:hypothetical protein JHK84_050096 [Glycine max]|nr:hypothetical protein JHK85_050823 [Glycine max]KAG5094508.1 hypothetical protein JHK84_050096 [Glycine max]
MQSRHALSFACFACHHDKRYHSIDEIRNGFQIFSDNLKLIRSTNRRSLTYMLGVNHFADWTWEEFTRHKLGAPQNCSATLKGNHRLTDVVLPDEKDWRKEGIVSQVKDQGNCRSSWTFRLLFEVEKLFGMTQLVHWRQLTRRPLGKNISLSEQQLVDCVGAFNNFGCNDGLPSKAFEYIKYNGGLDTEEAYPYTGKDGVYKFAAKNVAIQGAEDELKQAVAFVRPVSVAFEVSKDFQFYNNGVYTNTICGSMPMGGPGGRPGFGRGSGGYGAPTSICGGTLSERIKSGGRSKVDSRP